MATNKPRITAYVSPANKQRLKEYCDKNGFSESQGLDRILSQYFVGDTSSDVPTSVSNALSNTPNEDDVNDLVKGYYAQAMDNLNSAIANLREEFEQRLGELQA